MKLNSFRNFTQLQQTLLVRFGILMLIYSLTRIIFFLVNLNLFEETTFSGFMVMLMGGLKFDLSALLFINAIYILSQTIPFHFRYNVGYQKITNLFFLITNAIFIAVNTADIIYYQFILKRTTLSVIGNFENESNMLTLFARFIFIDYWYITLLVIAQVYFMVWLFKRTQINIPNEIGRAHV